MPSSRLRWECHGDIMRLIDKYGWTRALCFWEQGVKHYIAIHWTVIGSADKWMSKAGRNKRHLLADIVRAVRADL